MCTFGTLYRGRCTWKVTAGRRGYIYFALTPWSQVLHSSLVDCSLNVHCVSSRALYWLWSIKQSSRLRDILQGVADELWFSVTKGPLVTTSPSVIENNSWGDGIRSSRGVVRYVDNAVSGHSFPPSAFSNSNWEVPIALSFRLLASWWTGELQHSVLPLSLHLIFFF